jgi:hypothetical protein
MAMEKQPEGTSREKLATQVTDIKTGKTQVTKFTIFYDDPDQGKVKIGETHRVLAGKKRGWWNAVTVTGTPGVAIDPYQRHNDAMEWLKGCWLEDKPAEPAEAVLAPAGVNASPERLPTQHGGLEITVTGEAELVEGDVTLPDGRVITEAVIDALAAEAEAGYEQDKDGKWRPLAPAGVNFPAADADPEDDHPELPAMEGVPAKLSPAEAAGFTPAERHQFTPTTEEAAAFTRPVVDDGEPFPGQRSEGGHAEETHVVAPDSPGQNDTSTETYERESIREIPAGHPDDPSTWTDEPESIPADELGEVTDEERRRWRGQEVADADDWLSQVPPEPADMFAGQVFPFGSDDRHPVS